MPSLIDLPHEVIHCILILLDGADLGTLCQSCISFNEYVKNNALLHREIYLKTFDSIPSEAEGDPDWESELHAATTLQKLLETDNANVKRDNITTIAKTAYGLIQTAAKQDALNTAWLSQHFRKQVNRDTLLCSSSLFAKAGMPIHFQAETPAERQLSAKMHCMFGVPIDFDDDDSGLSEPTHLYARSRVYDLRNYTDDSFWGPFLDDGTQDVDWEKMEAIMVVLGYNLRMLSFRTGGDFPFMWDKPFDGVIPHSWSHSTKPPMPNFVAAIPRPVTSAALEDPYNITGTWMRVVCFLDYSDLYAYNFDSEDTPASQARPPIDTEEATRMITMTLHTVKLEAPGPTDGKTLPVAHFIGKSRSMHSAFDPNANSSIRGTVRLTPEGEVRWTSFSVFHGEERWRSEGIQVGGVQSRRGVLGTWFDKDFDAEGPAGPTAFWKTSDAVRKGDDEVQHVESIF